MTASISSGNIVPPFVLGVCGASGQIYAKWVLKTLIDRFTSPIRLIVSDAAVAVIRDELGVEKFWNEYSPERITVEDNHSMESVLASGSVPTAGMIVCPCSLNTLASLAAGMSDTLIKRAVQVHLKERRRLVVAVREMPLGLIDLENMVRLTQAGAVVTPISPPFYHHPAGIDQLAEFAAQKLVSLLANFDGAIQYRP